MKVFGFYLWQFRSTDAIALNAVCKNYFYDMHLFIALLSIIITKTDSILFIWQQERRRKTAEEFYKTHASSCQYNSVINSVIINSVFGQKNVRVNL